ncbi:hypothetical protein EDEG_01205 [Edhazardia aedis USNM 41457]|uniref:MHD domain-containing protein n=1 Tax=Edhazardia aedis (strain USNM 41457) TaxID=1003232 RepID=J9DA42_EDHAE|nr:hypothetical protein EDEG_01205 [Edhazardia aedis USNM 41457]|eukprot:EJW04591.1 hypothetical protein EDEG_01205 [Edhazardia aedis USNM 41457]
MEEDYIIKNPKDVVIYRSLACSQKPKKTMKFYHNGLEFVSAYFDKLLQKYFILEKMGFLKNTTSHHSLPKLISKMSISPLGQNNENNVLCKLEQKASKIVQSRDILIDIEENMFIIFQDDKLITSTIVGKLMLKKAFDERFVVSFSSKGCVEDISAVFTNKNGDEVELRHKTFLTYSRKPSSSELPIKIKFDKLNNLLYIENNCKSEIKNIKINFPLKHSTYKASATSFGAKSNVKIDETSINWVIYELNTFGENRKASLKIDENEIPNSDTRGRVILFDFEVDMWCDAGIEINHVKCGEEKCKDVFVATSCKAKKFEYRI